MTIPEAAQLVLQAGLMRRGCELHVLDMVAYTAPKTACGGSREVDVRDPIYNARRVAGYPAKAGNQLWRFSLNVRLIGTALQRVNVFHIVL